MNTKKGSFFSEQPLSLLVGAAAVLVMVLLLWNLLVPNYDQEEETQKSYLETFAKQLQIADTGETGEFRLLSLGENRREYYFVYFADTLVQRLDPLFTGPEFVLKENLENPYCICYQTDEGGVCNRCASAPLPLQKGGNIGIGTSETGFILKADGWTPVIQIKKEQNQYKITAPQEQ